MFGLSVLQDNIILTDQEFEQISALVYEHCGIDLHDGKKELVRSRLGKLLRQKEFSSFADYYKYVLSDSSKSALTELTDAISTNLTSFFRESQHFDFVSQTLLPELIGRKTGASRKIRCWSAGCSSGEEPYTIAITLLENLPQAGDWDIKILATDISSRVLQRASDGIYDAERVEPVPPAAKNRYLSKVRHNGQQMFQVSSALKKMIIFKYLNLMEPWPFRGPMDFIFCRNVMIYFDKPTQQKLVNRYWEVLDRGGYLFTGHSESLTGITHKFRYVQPTIYRKD
ncbi:MAG: protein-glutamate O-methyltransferase [Sedimentisphaerales bacterium]|nr:protein-glutamate O-methyltransferase [Sedimentisphaerales bacterium]